MLNINDRMRQGREAGFTLIELSIVLVLVGLLIGGILKGQELIAGTRLKTTVSQVDALRAAFNTFQDKYLLLPGDMNSTDSPNIAAGVGGVAASATAENGQIGGALATLATAIAAPAGTENSYALYHLSRAQLVGGVQVPTTNGSGINVLPAKVTGSSLMIGYFTTLGRHGVLLSGGTGYAGTAALEPGDGRELDTKYDDGLPSTGDIQALDATGATAASCVTAGTPNTYTVAAAPTVSCVLSFTLD